MTTYRAVPISELDALTTVHAVGPQTFHIITTETNAYILRADTEKLVALAQMTFIGSAVSVNLFGDAVRDEDRYDAFAGLRVSFDTATSVFDGEERQMNDDGTPVRRRVPAPVVEAFLKHIDSILGA